MENARNAGRNDPCPCGSGLKYKKCCFGKSAVRKKITAKWIQPNEKTAFVPPPFRPTAVDFREQTEESSSQDLKQ